VAIFRLDIRSISRGTGRSAVAAAAYRAGERLRDERSGKLHNHSQRTDVPHKEILLPAGVDVSRIAWVKQRAELWNAAERAERRWDARVGREFQLGIPHELSADQRRDLARAFSQELADRYQAVVDLAVHEPRPAGDPRNHHAHLMLTTREITATGFGAKTGLDLASVERQRRGLLAGIPEIKAVRERWAQLTNEALQSAGVEARVDHRSLQAQGIDRLPGPRFPYSAIMQERRGARSEVAERIRAKHLERVQARHMRSIAQESPRELSPRQPSPQPSPQPLPQPLPELSTIDEVRQRAVKAWLQMRAKGATSQPSAALPEQAATTDDELAL
jgi:ATP-dependent exoDNAse (exonuclease V) alpha subunit